MSDPIRKGKLDFIGRAERRQKILNYIRQNGVVKSSQIQDALGISRSSLSDDMRKLLNDNLVLSEKRGTYRINLDLAQSSAVIAFNKPLLRQWLILALLSEKEHTLLELTDLLAEYDFPCSPTTLRSDLKVLLNHHLIQVKGISPSGNTADTDSAFNNRNLYSSNALSALDTAAIQSYFDSFSSNTERKLSANTRVKIAVKESLDNKLLFFNIHRPLSGTHTSSSGKVNKITDEQLRRLNVLKAYDYEHYCMQVVYHTYCHDRITTCFYTGLVVYSVETNRIYLMGKNENKEYVIISLDSVDLAETQNANEHPEHKRCLNTLFRSAEFMTIFHQMLNISTADPIEVEVCFSNLSYVREKVQRLHELRSATSSIRATDDHKDLIYKDTIRGLEDFARYLRGFGSFARVIKPEALKDRMRLTAEKILTLYEEDN